MTGVDSILVTAGDFSALLSGELFEISELLTASELGCSLSNCCIFSSSAIY